MVHSPSTVKLLVKLSHHVRARTPRSHASNGRKRAEWMGPTPMHEATVGGACLSLTVLRLSTLFISPALSIALGSLQRLLPCSQLEGGCASYRCSVKVRVSELVIMTHRRRVETTRDSARP